jgi:hypothetical protein
LFQVQVSSKKERISGSKDDYHTVTARPTTAYATRLGRRRRRQDDLARGLARHTARVVSRHLDISLRRCPRSLAASPSSERQGREGRLDTVDFWGELLSGSAGASCCCWPERKINVMYIVVPLFFFWSACKDVLRFIMMTADDQVIISFPAFPR